MAIDRAPSGKWRARWRDHAGVQRSLSFDRKIDARQHLEHVRSDLARGTYVAPEDSSITLADWADKWLAGAMNLGDGGRDTYRRDLDRYILPALGHLRLRRITDAAIDEFLRAELDAGLAPSSVHRHYRTLHRMLAVAVERGRLVKNPCTPVTPPSVDQPEMRFLTPDEIEALAASITDRYRTWVYFATYAGPRWSECVGLRRRHVDGARVTIAEQLIRRADGEWHRDPPKGKTGRRTITVPGFLADLLAEQLEEYSGPGPDGLVFPNSAGRPMNGPSFRGGIFTPACAKAGLGTIERLPPKPPRTVGRAVYSTDVRIHDLRHTAVALAVAAEAHPKAIQHRMGHASITVTLDRYGHLFPEMDDKIADRLDLVRPEQG